MKSEEKLPKEYKSFKELIICSNKFVNGKIPLKVDNNIVFLIGKGHHPVIWITVQKTSASKERTYIVSNNESLHKDISINFSNNTTVISYLTKIILKVVKLTDEKAEIVEMDLRHIGLNIYGDKNGLHTGGNILKGNIFENLYTMIQIGG